VGGKTGEWQRDFLCDSEPRDETLEIQDFEDQVLQPERGEAGILDVGNRRRGEITDSAVVLETGRGIYPDICHNKSMNHE